MKKITLLIFLLINHLSFSQITAWDTNGLSGSEATFNATTQDPNLNISTLSRGSGINPNDVANTFSSDNFTLSNSQALAITNDDYLEFNISAVSGYKVSLSSLDVNFRRSSTGPDNFLWRYSLDGINFIDIGSSFVYNLNPTNGTTQTQIDLSVIPELQNVFNTTITFRLYAWGATGSTGSFSIGKLTGNDLEINGLVEALCASTVTWDGTSWSPSTPDSSTNAILTADYNTNTAGQTSFSACSLTLNSGIQLTIAQNTYVEVNNDVTNNGRINIQNEGSFVQVEDTAVYDDSGSSFPEAAIVDKETAHLENWYEYTYWSSPVANETFGNALFYSSPYRRFEFNAANFRDSQYETFNDNTLINGAGVDDIDDNGDDWFLKSSGDIMTPGVGYAATHSISSFIFGPNKYLYTFKGTLNNGVITVPIERNDAETADNNWNLIGNPYPSAIDVDLFFTENNLASNPTDGKLTGTIYLWSQNTAPTSTANGNQPLNFSNSDYATINGTMETVGGDGITPNRYIPSGQGFFVLYDDAAGSATGTVKFTNSMRVSGNNNQFFRASATNNPNKIWLRLTSDIGLNNQIGIGYVEGATSQNDGGFYDAKKTGAVMNSLAFYSVIPGDNNKFVIQGKATSDLNLDEVIPLGFLTNIDVATIYTISIDNLEGDFLTNNPIYLKDNLTSTIQDLTVSDYNFTSNVGEFNNRFEIVFNNASLSIDNKETTLNNLSIIELENDNVMFKVGQNLKIKTIEIFDTLGKVIYSFKGDNYSEIYNLKNLNKNLYIAKVTLNNGQTITKKAIKK
ncbi:T9SS type A sorting domain-containing protein [Mesoflavibacter zeaxanthinifaciens]|uniref:T9SS type A sorting domain-containing protein n=1 Tax=Mesoflavibacter zeaxanthinifaciens TaxID=393060 RepID=UPI003A8FB7EF